MQRADHLASMSSKVFFTHHHHHQHNQIALPSPYSRIVSDGKVQITSLILRQDGLLFTMKPNLLQNSQISPRIKSPLSGICLNISQHLSRLHNLYSNTAHWVGKGGGGGTMVSKGITCFIVIVVKIVINLWLNINSHLKHGIQK